MVNEHMYELGAAPSEIRQLFAYGLSRKAEIGAENVFDFSLGNPSVPTPDEVTQAMRDVLELPSNQVHGYTMASGDDAMRKAVADNLNARFNAGVTGDNVFMTVGAAASLASTLTGVTNTDEEVIVPVPYFPEYRVWIEAAGCSIKEVPVRISDFQLDTDAIAAAITDKTAAIIVNSPNNPVGCVYTPETLTALADVLRAASERVRHPVYLISDEPYRELAYDAPTPWTAGYYANTIVCYSWSKSFSLPGDRIGYVLVPPTVDNWQHVFTAIAGAARSLGFVCAPALLQHAIARAIDAPVNVDEYRENRDLLCSILDRAGIEYIQPAGAFYLWAKALEPDARAFSGKAKKHELILVPSDSFGVKGWVRLGYCVSRATIENSAPAFEALAAEYR